MWPLEEEVRLIGGYFTTVLTTLKASVLCSYVGYSSPSSLCTSEPSHWDLPT